MANDKLKKIDVQEVLELNMSQEGMLFHHLESADSNSYNIQLSFSIHGPLDIDVLKNAFSLVQSNNEALRSVFRWRETKRPVQIILKSQPVEINFIDLVGSRGEEIAVLVENISRKDRMDRFDLVTLPLRLSVLCVGAGAYVFNVTYHHILFDGWSNGIFLNELFQYYNRLIKNDKPVVVDKPAYKDIQQSIKARHARIDDGQFWRRYLADYNVKSFYSEHSPGLEERQDTQKIQLYFSPQGLDDLVRNHNITKATVIYAAYGLVLQKYYGSGDAVFGTAVANRDADIAGIDKVVGNFITTIPLRLQTAGNISLLEVIKKLNADLIGRNDYSHSSYFSIKKIMGLKPGENLFDSIVVIENYPFNGEVTKDNNDYTLKLRSVYENTDMPLVITVFFQEQLKFEFSFKEGIFSKTFVNTLAHHLLRVLECIISKPEIKVESLSMLSQAEAHQLQYEFNNTRTEFEDKTIVSLMEEQVDRSPGKIAILFSYAQLTFKELNESSNQLARGLRRKGAREGDVVGLLLPRCPELMISIFGVMKAGCTYVPIDPEFPVDRIRYIVEKSSIKLLLTAPALAGIYELLDAVEPLDATADEFYAKEAVANLDIAFPSSQGAYLIYTSGSTGHPKGILVEHRNVVNYVHGVAADVGLDKDCSILCLTTASFDIFVTEAILPVLYGFRAVVADEHEQKDPGALLRLITQCPVNTLQITPSHLQAVLKNGRLDFLRSVGIIMIGGEPLPFELLQALRKNYSGKIYNMYGPTETTVWSTLRDLTGKSSVDIGRPICNTTIYILDERLNLQPIGVPGQLCIGGMGVARGYFGNETLTNEKFVVNPYKKGERIYLTGDRALWLPDGNLRLLGRMDNQVKLRGFRIELGEIEHQLLRHSSIEAAVAIVRQHHGDNVLVAYYVSGAAPGVQQLKSFLAKKLPEYMIPSFFIHLQQMPLSPNGKVDRHALPPPVVDTTSNFVAPASDIEEMIAVIWSDLLGEKAISIDRNFFDIGGDSLKLISASNRIREAFNREVSISDLFAYPTISSLAQFISGQEDVKVETKRDNDKRSCSDEHIRDTDIAIIGMAGSFPRCADLDEFWLKLRDGTDLITRQESMDDDPIVHAKGLLAGSDQFDASFFEYLPSEAGAMDPQIRVFHECVYEALENAGYNPFKYDGKIGLYGGATLNPYYNIAAGESNTKDWIEKWEAVTYADKDFMCPRVSYKLNLRGPSITISTACSTSLVAVDRACNDLIADKCDIALAGGVSITMHDNNGYFYQSGMIMSSDGKCRAFDSQSDGTVGGNGAGVVVLKKLRHAIPDGDIIHAVIKGSAINNDGNDKVGFTAPSVAGQSEVIKMAIRNAGIDEASITYVETHGTGTALGDPIEIAALTRAFSSSKRQYCAIGSVKTNIGHLDAAAGIAGLIKTVYALKNRQIPASLHFTTPSVAIDFKNSPFYVNATLQPWQNGNFPRRAGVSSFGIGGTNAHVILEEAPGERSSSESRQYQLLSVTAKSEKSLLKNLEKLGDYLRQTPDKLPDIAYTLNQRRAHFSHRKVIICKDKSEAIDLIGNTVSKGIRLYDGGRKTVVFMFPGVGSQYKGMCRDLYEHESYFRTIVDKCFELFASVTGVDLKKIIFSDQTDVTREDELDEIRYAHPSIFIMEYAMARLLMQWGIRPDFMIGHSIGEYTAACIGGVFSLEDALCLVIKRSQLIHQVQTGRMLGVSMPEAELNKMLIYWDELSLAAVNSQDLCVVSGSEQSVLEFQRNVDKDRYACQLVRTSHASHSYVMDEILKDYERAFDSIKINHQQIPFISNLTGKPAVDDEIRDSRYWVKHLRHTVRFSDGIEYLMAKKGVIFVEAGPGNVLGTFVRANKKAAKHHYVVDVIRHQHKQDHDLKCLLAGLGKLWQHGVALDYEKYYANEKRITAQVPAYAFDKVRYPLNAGLLLQVPAPSVAPETGIAEWFYVPSWEVAPPAFNAGIRLPGKVTNVVFADSHGICEGLKKQFNRPGENTIFIRQAAKFKVVDESSIEINARDENDYAILADKVARGGALRIVFGWGISDDTAQKLTIEKAKANLDIFFYSLIYLVKALTGTQRIAPSTTIVSITNNARPVLNGERVSPEKATLLGALKVIQKEYRNITCRNIDIVLPGKADPALTAFLFNEITAQSHHDSIAYRHHTSFVESYRQLRLPTPANTSIPFVSGGVYLITGGIGGIGLSFAKKIAGEVKDVTIILLGRKILPGKDHWSSWLLSDGSKAHEAYDAIKELLEIEASGAVVHYESVDVGDEGALKEVISGLRQKFGEIRGVVHAAGIPDYAGIIYNRAKKENEKIFSSKIYGTILLSEVFAGQELDFFVLCSSLSAALPIEGQVGYVAANMFLNSFSSYNFSCNNIRTISIGWNAWRGIGFAVKASKRIDVEEAHEINNAISSDEGYDVLLKAIQFNLPESVISRLAVSDLIRKANDESELLKSWTAGGEADQYAVSHVEFLPGSVERKMQELWQKILGVPEVFPGDDFFEAGGNSLKALTMIARIFSAFKVEISIKEFFNHSSLSALSEYVSSFGNRSAVESVAVAIPKTELKEYYDLSSAQKRLFFIYGFDRTSTAYNVPVVFKVEGFLDKDRIRNVFKKLISHHESLRTSVHVIDTLPVQRIAEDPDFDVEWFNADSGSMNTIIRSFVRPFDLSKAPLIRVGIVAFDTDQHVLLIDMHHIVADGISERVLVEWFKAIYSGEDLAVLPLQYKDYAAWQQGAAQQRRISGQRTFWLNEFREEVKMLDLPTDFPRPPVQTFKGASCNFDISAHDTTKLKAMAEHEKVTMFMLLLSVFNVLLSKLGNQDDIVIGTPVANRQHADVEDMIGMFANTLALRNSVRGDLTFREFLSEVKEKTLACFDNQAYQYEDLIEVLKITRDTSRNALFNAVLVLHDAAFSRFAVPGLRFEAYAFENQTSKFDITLKATETGGKLSMSLEYASALFKKDTIARFARYFAQIISCVLSDPGIRIFEIEVMPDDERAQLLKDCNRTDVTFPREKTVIDLFEEQAMKTPDSVAIKAGDRIISYSALDEKADKIASLLTANGVNAGDLVGLLLDRSIDTIAGILGIMKAGGAYLPVDPDYPMKRINYMIEDSGIKVLLTTGEIMARLRTDILLLPIEDAAMVSWNGKVSRIISKPSDLCYVIYTSGTTGNPKGVMVEHRNVVRLFFNDAFQFDFSAADNWTMFHSHCFDFSVWEIFGALLFGGKLIVISRMESRDPNTFLNILCDEEVTVLNQTPSAFYNVMPLDLASPEKRLKLKYVIFGGEALAPGKLKPWRQKYPDTKLINMYGITETTVHVTYKEISEREIGSNVSNIGSPIPTLSVYILDKFQRLVPKGVIGELYVGGEGVTRGYLQKPELTDQKFVLNPYNSSERLYRSGDLARFCSPDEMEYLGRIDDQVQLRGFRIELGEIKSRFDMNPSIIKSLVVAREMHGNKCLVVYYVSDEELSVTGLRSSLSEQLPDYMVPSYFVRMNELPLTSNGKIDRKALPEPVVDAPKEYSAPSGELEEKLVEIWSVILKIKKGAISVKKSFFELGGDSIKIMRLNSLINERLQIQVSIPDLFRYTSVKALAEHIRNGNTTINDNNREVVSDIGEMQSTLSKLIDASE